MKITLTAGGFRKTSFHLVKSGKLFFLGLPRV